MNSERSGGCRKVTLLRDEDETFFILLFLLFVLQHAFVNWNLPERAGLVANKAEMAEML